MQRVDMIVIDVEFLCEEWDKWVVKLETVHLSNGLYLDVSNEIFNSMGAHT